MTSSPSPLLPTRPVLRSLCTPFTWPRAILRVFEPAEGDRRPLLRRLLNGTYRKPFLIEDGAERILQFSLAGGAQSVMRCTDPDELVVPYTRDMMAFLLLQPEPRHIVMAGLGGGSLAEILPPPSAGDPHHRDRNQSLGDFASGRVPDSAGR